VIFTGLFALRRQPLLVLLISAVLFVAACSNNGRDTPLIFAAASLAEVLTETAELYEEQTGSSVEFSFGGSTALANQVARLNAPADGVVLAGQQPVELLIESGLVEASAVTNVAANSLVVATAGSDSLENLSGLLANESRIAIADPNLAPAGQYAKEALQSVAVWESLQSRLVPLLDVRSALAALKTGSVNFAIVYATDAQTEPDLNIALAVDPTLHLPVIYPAAPVTAASEAESAARFFEFLQTPVAQQVFLRHGFSQP
jgi:molybdate transport system substrate-binding protein